MWQPEVDPAIESSATVRANMESSASLDAPKRGESATNMERKKVETNSIAYLMRKAIGGNQVANKWQSSGNPVAIQWQSSGNPVAIKWQSIAIRARRQRRTRSRTQGAPSAACAC